MGRKGRLLVPPGVSLAEVVEDAVMTVCGPRDGNSVTDTELSRMVKKGKRKPKKEPTSRSGRWAMFTNKAQLALSDIKDRRDELRAALDGLSGLKDEYEEWKGNLPENLQSSTLGEKLDEVTGLDLEDCLSTLDSAIEDVEGVLDEAEGIDLPRGFGRD